MAAMKSTLAFLLILLAIQLEWTHPRAFQGDASGGIRYIECSPCEFTDPDHPQAPSRPSRHETPVNDDALETNDDDVLAAIDFRLVDVCEWTRVDPWSRFGSQSRRRPSSGHPPATVGATLRC